MLARKRFGGTRFDAGDNFLGKTLKQPALGDTMIWLSYQLHAMRPLRELIRALPAPLQRFEMEHGMALRTRWMFTPLCDELVARIAILDRLAG